MHDTMHVAGRYQGRVIGLAKAGEVGLPRSSQAAGSSTINPVAVFEIGM